MKRYSIVGELIAKDDKRDQLLEILTSAEKLLLTKNSDCHLYSVNISANHPSSIFVHEIWTNEESHQNSLKDEEILNLIMQGKPLIENMVRHYTMTEISKSD